MEKIVEAIPKEFLQTLKILNQNLLYTKPADPAANLHQSFLLETVSKESETNDMPKYVTIKAALLIHTNLFSNSASKERLAQNMFLLIVQSKSRGCLIGDLKTIGFMYMRAKKIHEILEPTVINNLLNPASVLKLPAMKAVTLESLESSQEQAVTLLTQYIRIFEVIEALQTVLGLKVTQTVQQTAELFFDHFEVLSDDLSCLNKKQFVMEYCSNANGLQYTLPSKQNKRAVLNTLILILIKL